jgi:hypothetical protein
VNIPWVLFHLQEAHEELTQTIAAMKSDPEYDFAEYHIAMMHLYNHLNTAWNARDVEPKRAEACSEEDFYTWRSFPTDIDLSG